jgi:hypothetical protein
VLREDVGLFAVVVVVAEIVVVPTAATLGLDDPPQPHTSTARPTTPTSASVSRIE